MEPPRCFLLWERARLDRERARLERVRLERECDLFRVRRGFLELRGERGICYLRWAKILFSKPRLRAILEAHLFCKSWKCFFIFQFVEARAQTQ